MVIIQDATIAAYYGQPTENPAYKAYDNLVERMKGRGWNGKLSDGAEGTLSNLVS